MPYASVSDILNELNLENGSNYKMAVLEKHKDNDLLKRVLKMAYDRVTFTYGITMKNVKYTPEALFSTGIGANFLSDALDYLEENFVTRKVTGNAAIDQLSLLLETLSKEDAKVIEKILGRDLKINVGRTNINKVFKNLIIKPIYMRCDVYNNKTSKNISFPGILQLKADGTYRQVTVENGKVTFNSRSGEEYDYPVLSNLFEQFPDGVYTGELTVNGITDRAAGNGLINSDNPPHDLIKIELWDYITLQEYSNAALKIKNTTTYLERFNNLLTILNDFPESVFFHVRVIPYLHVNNLKEALLKTSEWMNEGFEGGVLKDLGMVFQDGTSKKQLKLKLKIDCEMRIVGYQDGTKGTKREGKVGSLIFENDEGTIKGKCSGFTDEQLDELTLNWDKYLNKVMTVQFNDLTKAEGNDFYALSHPRFIEVRNDKDETDTLEKVFALREMAMTIGEL